jgi:hypothetical protein
MVFETIKDDGLANYADAMRCRSKFAGNDGCHVHFAHENCKVNRAIRKVEEHFAGD